MRAKIRQILEECIETGIESGYLRAHKSSDDPYAFHIYEQIENAIWLEIDQWFDFERNACDEVVEGFDQLEKEREWVGLEEVYGAGRFYTRDFLDGAKWAEEKLRELNT